MYILSFFLFFMSFLILITKELSNNRGIRIDLSENNIYIYISTLFFLLSMYILYLKFFNKNKSKKKKINFSICPTCQESFKYEELENGKCKYCDDVDTVNIEEYYKNNSDK